MPVSRRNFAGYLVKMKYQVGIYPSIERDTIVQSLYIAINFVSISFSFFVGIIIDGKKKRYFILIEFLYKCIFEKNLFRNEGDIYLMRCLIKYRHVSLKSNLNLTANLDSVTIH